LKCLFKIVKFYNPEDDSEDKTMDVYKELFTALKSTPYSGDLLTIMDQEIADFDKFKEDAEYILSESNPGYTSSDTDEDTTKFGLLEYKVKKWKYLINEKVDRRTLQKVIKNGKELKCDVKDLIKKLESLESSCQQIEEKLANLTGKYSSEEFFSVINEGVSLIVPPKKLLLKAISTYRKMEEINLNVSEVLSCTPTFKASFSKLSLLISLLSSTTFLTHPLSPAQITALKSLHSS
jgi:hypothetical protein